MQERLGQHTAVGAPFVKPAGVGARKVIPTNITTYDRALQKDILASGVPKRYVDAIMGTSRDAARKAGITPITSAERVFFGRAAYEGKEKFARKWHQILFEAQGEKKAAKTLGEEAVRRVKKAKKVAPEDIQADFSPLTGESGVLMLNRMAETLNPEQLKVVAKNLDFKKTSGNLLPLWYNALLLNPATMGRNFLGNFLEAGEQVVTRTAKGLLRGDLKGAFSQWAQFGSGLTNALTQAGEAWRTGLIGAVRRGEEEFMEELPSKITKWMPASKTMAWMDDFFTTLTYHMDLQDRIYRRAAQGSDDTMSAIAKMNSNVPKDLSEAAIKSARRVVYRDFVPHGGFNYKVLKTIRSFQDIGAGGAAIGRLILPFGRTPYMIGKRVAEYTPLNFFQGAYNIMSGGLGSIQAEEGIERIMRSLYGTSIMTALYFQAQNGNITGEMNHLTEAQKTAVRAGGTEPASVKMGDQWITYRNLGPLSALFQFVGNTYEDVKSGKYTPEEIPVKASGNLLGAAVDATFLPQLSVLIAAMADPDRYGKQGASQLMSYVVPSTGLAAMARAIDPTIREYDKLDPEQVARTRFPGASQALQPKLGLFGEEIKRSATGDPGAAEKWELFLSPVRRKELSQDPVIQEIARLQAPLGVPSMALDIPSLTEDDKWISAKAMGMAQKQFVTRVMSSPFYQRLPDDRKVKVLEKMHAKGRRVINNRVKLLTRQGKSITYRALLKGLVAE
jgi:hypothetical protein